MAKEEVREKKKQALSVKYSYWLNFVGVLSMGHGTNNEVGLSKEEYFELVEKTISERVDFYKGKFVAPVELEVMS